MKDLTNSVKEYVLSEGCDLVKVGSVDRFDSAARDYHPKKLLPETQSVIVFAARQIDGVVDYLTESRSEYTINFFISSWLLDTTAYKLAKFIEKEGFRSRPVSYAWSGESVFPGVHKWEYGTFRAPLSYQHTAEAVGLGRRGLSSLLITPEFGPRVRLMVVLTEAKLIPDHVLPGRLCHPENCGYRCVKACPVGAISPSDGLYRPRCANAAVWNGLRCGICMKACPEPEVLREWSQSPENQIPWPPTWPITKPFGVK